MSPPVSSKKLWAFIIGITAILIIVVMAVLWAVDNAVVGSAIASITSLVGLHITNQASVDRAQANSPYFPSGGMYPPAVVSPLITSPIITSPPPLPVTPTKKVDLSDIR